MRTLALLLILVAPALSQDANEGYDWLLVFHNGDSVHCKLDGLEGSKLTVQWAIAPETPVTLDLKDIAQIGRAKEIDIVEPNNTDRLRMQDGSLLFGRALKFGAKTLEFEVPPLGKLVIDIRNVLELSRGKQEIRMPDTKEGDYVIATKTGNVLTGRLETDDMGQLVLKGDGMTATLGYDSIAVILFPRPTIGPEVAEKEDETISGVQIKLRNGTMLGGKVPRLEQGMLAFKLGTGHDVKVSVDELLQISFLDYGELIGRTGVRAILVWGAWADPADEYRKTVNILQEQFKGSWRITESNAKKFDRKFRRALFAVRTLVIPEMEKLRSPNGMAEARQLKPLLTAFVRGGGNVVILGIQAQHVPWVKEAGLFDLRVLGQVDGQQIAFTAEGARLSKGVGDKWRAVNATFGYAIQPGIPAISLAAHAGKSVVVGRRVGRGWILSISADYYMTNKQTSKLLANAVTLR